MRRLFRHFFDEDSGQDLIEYTLLIAFLALASVGLFLNSGTSVSQTWSSANSVLSAAANSQSPTSGGGGGGDGGGGDGGGDHH